MIEKEFHGFTAICDDCDEILAEGEETFADAVAVVKHRGSVTLDDEGQWVHRCKDCTREARIAAAWRKFGG